MQTNQPIDTCKGFGDVKENDMNSLVTSLEEDIAAIDFVLTLDWSPRVAAHWMAQRADAVTRLEAARAREDEMERAL